MRKDWRAILVVLLGLLLPLNCTCGDLLPSASPPSPTHTAVQENDEHPGLFQGMTGAEGEALILTSEGSERAIVRVEDADSGLPVEGLQVYFLEKDSRYLAVAVDPNKRYVAAWSQGTIEEGSTSNLSLDLVAYLSFSSPARAQTLTEALVIAKAVSWVSSLQDAAALVSHPPDLLHWGLLYEDRCWSGEDLAKAVGAAGLVIPGIETFGGPFAAGMEEIAEAIFLVSQHLAEEESKQLLSALDRPVRIRSYHLGIPALGMVPVGWCEAEATATSAPRATPAATATASAEATYSGPFMYGPTYSIDYPADKWELRSPAPLGSAGLVHLSIPSCILSLDIRPVGTEGFWECAECDVAIRLGDHRFVRSVLLVTSTKLPVVKYDLVSPEHPEWFCTFLLWVETSPDSSDFVTCRDDAEAVLATLAIDLPLE